ncbi:MafI family immunity protein [Catellatospora vulcania]|uniref:MafI family immunity protein n=1 Tax=Catellatospora vulcania TaxID=1460450 RepID=UPI0012D437DF|nr:MafI family immunity protein [Catellatospora vulcania]
MYWTEDRLRFKRLVEGLSGRADVDAEAAMGAPLDARLADAVVDVLAGEEQLALDTVCVNLSDYDVQLTREEYAIIAGLAARWAVDSRVLDGLGRLVVRDEPPI